MILIVITMKLFYILVMTKNLWISWTLKGRWFESEINYFNTQENQPMSSGVSDIKI